MSAKNEQVYGLTIMSPVLENEGGEFSHVQQLRMLLSRQPRDNRSPFAKIPGTHAARFAILDSLPFVSLSVGEESLNSSYLIFEANVDGDCDSYLLSMAVNSGEFVDDVWNHCVGYPGTADRTAFVHFMRRCQLDTTLFFADVNDRSVEETVAALNVQRSVLTFIGENQGKSGADLKKAFIKFMHELKVSGMIAAQKVSVNSNE